jgi:hypothetical protein
MAYMVYQQYASAIRDAYGDGREADELRGHLAEARRARAWLASLEVDPAIRASLVEPMAVVEDAFEGLVGGPGPEDPVPR